MGTHSILVLEIISRDHFYVRSSANAAADSKCAQRCAFIFVYFPFAHPNSNHICKSVQKKLYLALTLFVVWTVYRLRAVELPHRQVSIISHSERDYNSLWRIVEKIPPVAAPVETTKGTKEQQQQQQSFTSFTFTERDQAVLTGIRRAKPPTADTLAYDRF